MSNFEWVKEMKPAFVELEKSMGRETAVERLAASGQPIRPLSFAHFARPLYTGEVGKKDNDLIFHFFALPQAGFPDRFDDLMGDAFIMVFKHPDKLESVYSDELRSWAVRVRGYGDNPSASELSTSVFDVLDRLLQT